MNIELKELTIQEIAYHRNGIGGCPFWVVRFRYDPDSFGEKENFLSIIGGNKGMCAVIALDRIPARGLAFAANTNRWRGDNFENALRQAIDDWK